jgi:hypothetical protein
MDAIKKLKKPWFLGIPDPEGSWNEGRTDDDIYFWQNFAKCGLKAYLAPNVKIGHLQLGVTFPGKVEDNFKPIHHYVTDVKKGIHPDDYIPKLEVLK